MQVALLVIAAVLAGGALGMVWRFRAQVLQGRRRWARGLSPRGVLLLGLCVLLVVGWLLLAYGPMPVGFFLSLIDLLPRESAWFTVAILLWACIGVASALLPKQPASAR